MTSSKKTRWERIKAGWNRVIPGYRTLTWLLGILLAGLISSLVAVMVSDFFGGFFECLFRRLLDTPDKKETINFIGFGISGVILLLGAVSISKRADAQVENNRLVETGNDNDRFKVAVDHLGSRSKSARIASFYEFHYLAKDREHLRESIFNILCGHLRQIATNTAYGENERPTEEVQSLLDVLFKSKGEFIFEGMEANLQKVNLKEANLRNAYLQRANLYDADLQKADLAYSKLSGAYLNNAKLQKADLTKANLRNARLIKSKLYGATLYFTKLQKAYMRGAKLCGATISYSELQDINANFAQFQGADVDHCNFSNADLKFANIQGADLQYSKFYAAKLIACNMQGTNLLKTEFQGASVHSLKLQGAECRDTAMGGVAAHHNLSDIGMSDRINRRVEEWGDISEVIYSGGVTQDEIDNIAELIKKHRSETRSNEFRNRMADHTGELEQKGTNPSSKEPSIGYKEIIFDPYTQEDADKWIKEYNEAMKPSN